MFFSIILLICCDPERGEVVKQNKYFLQHVCPHKSISSSSNHEKSKIKTEHLLCLGYKDKRRGPCFLRESTQMASPWPWNTSAGKIPSDQNRTWCNSALKGNLNLATISAFLIFSEDRLPPKESPPYSCFCQHLIFLGVLPTLEYDLAQKGNPTSLQFELSILQTHYKISQNPLSGTSTPCIFPHRKERQARGLQRNKLVRTAAKGALASV